jgi:hypothetical protein
MTINEKRAIVGLAPIKGMDNIDLTITRRSNEKHNK